jgi:dihydrofolate reductase
MRKLIVDEWMSLDGVVQAPAGAEEDSDGGFARGGWHLRYFDELAQDWVVEGFEDPGGFLLGRRTYEILGAYWPSAPEEEQAIARPLNTLPKYVASRTLTEPLGWHNSTLLRGDLAEAVTALKQEEGKDLRVIGSSQLVQELFRHDLVDELRLMVDPVLLGGGKRAFPDDGILRSLRLVDSRVATTGAILATYAPADA